MKTADEKLNPSKDVNGGLVALMKVNDETLVKSRERALEWLKTIDPAAAELNEQAVVGLLVEKAYGTAEKTAQRAAELVARQNADGGWSARLGEGRGSDAFATGQSLYALCRTGTSREDPSIEKALRYLIGTQEKDGSWRVPTAAIHEPSARADRVVRTDAVYQFWGTSWAMLGMLQTLPETTGESVAAVAR
jgi:squalene cyclase